MALFRAYREAALGCIRDSSHLGVQPAKGGISFGILAETVRGYRIVIVLITGARFVHDKQKDGASNVNTSLRRYFD